MNKLLFFIPLFLFSLKSEGQFVNSAGITVGVGMGNQKFFYSDPAAISRKNYIFGFNASIMGEFMTRDYVRWVSEIQYNQKGSVDRRPEGSYGNSLQYLCWNNYLKIRYETYSLIPYVLVGPRLEYTLSQAESSPDAYGSFLPLHVSLAVGAGTELVSYSKFKLFAEAFYNPDIMPAYVRPGLHIKNKNIELRVGVKYEFNGGRESCNTPVYIED
jgi:hypothetical protein